MFLDKYLGIDPTNKAAKTAVTIGEIAVVIFAVSEARSWYKARQKKKEQERLMELYRQQQIYGTWFPGAAPGTAPGTTPGTTTAPKVLTYNPSSYASVADAMEAAMNTAGTDEAAVLANVKKMKTADDWDALVNAFGERTNYVFGIPAYTEGLAYWINDEFNVSDTEYKQLLQHLASINATL